MSIYVMCIIYDYTIYKYIDIDAATTNNDVDTNNYIDIVNNIAFVYIQNIQYNLYL